MDIYGVIGWPVKHTLSPFMHNAAFKKLGIDAEYLAFEIPPEKLEDFILNRKDVAGFNITIPHKIKAREILEKEFPVEKDNASMEQDLYYVNLTGAINTVKRSGNNLEYRNTDAPGFSKALEEDLKFVTGNKTVLVIGCGGAGRAIIAALSWKSMYVRKIYVYEVNNAQVDSTEEHFSKLPEEWPGILQKKVEFISLNQLPEVIKDCQLLVNASSVGMKEGDLSPVDKKLLHKDLFVYDVVYNRETQLIKDAKSLFGEKHASGGLGMLLYQGAHAFEFWTGRKAPVDVMKEALLTTGVRLPS